MNGFVWVSPLPPERTGVSAYSAELAPRLAQHLPLSLLRPSTSCGGTSWTPPPPLKMIEEAPPEARTIVHVGNNPYHEWVLPFLKRPGSIAVLHDVVLHHLLVEVTLARGDRPAYERAIRRAEPEAGPALAAGRRYGFGGGRDTFLFPAFSAFLEGASAVITHSSWAAQRVCARLPGLPVKTVRMGVDDPGTVDRERLRGELGVGDEELCLMHLGFLTPAKGLEVVLGGVAAAERLGVSVRVVLVGEGAEEGRVARCVEALGLEARVSGTGWVDEATMRTLPAAADLGVVVRRPSAGETSAAVLRFLACGTPAAVSGVRQLLEVPETAAPRLTPGCESADLARLLVALAANTEERRRRRTAAREVFEADHTMDVAVSDYVRVLRDLGGPGS